MSIVKNGVLSFLDKIGINCLYRKKNRDKTRVLMYHGVVKDDWKIADRNWLQVRESVFREQMKHLKKYYDVVSLQKAIATTTISSSKPKVVITFDDGYMNNYTVAYPILKELNLPATIFLVPSMIGTEKLFWYDRIRTTFSESERLESIEKIIESYKTKHPHIIDDLVDKDICNYRTQHQRNIHDAYGILTYEQIHEMQDSELITFDSHTHRHEILTQLSDTEILNSLKTSLETLKENGVRCGKVFCYPNGCYDNNHFEILERLGFSSAVSTINKLWDTFDYRFEIPRIGIGRNMTRSQFCGLLSGMWQGIATTIKKFKIKENK